MRDRPQLSAGLDHALGRHVDHDLAGLTAVDLPLLVELGQRLEEVVGRHHVPELAFELDDPPADGLELRHLLGRDEVLLVAVLQVVVAREGDVDAPLVGQPDERLGVVHVVDHQHRGEGEDVHAASHQRRNRLFQLLEQAGDAALLVLARVGVVHRDVDLVHAGIDQFVDLGLGEKAAVGQDGDVPEARQVLDFLDHRYEIAPQHRLAAGEDDDQGVEAPHDVGEIGHLVAVGDLPVIAEVAARVAALGDFDRDGERPLVEGDVEELTRCAELFQRAQGNLHSPTPESAHG